MTDEILDVSRYTPEQIQRIVDAADCRDPDKIHELIRVLECEKIMLSVVGLAELAIENPTDRRDQWATVEALAAKLSRAIANVEKWGHPFKIGNLDDAEEHKRAQLIDTLAKMEGEANSLATLYGQAAIERKGRRNVKRDSYIRGVISAWPLILGRDLSFSRDSNGAVVGPLWRFFEAAAGPVLLDDMPSAETFAGIVREQKKQLSGARAPTRGAQNAWMAAVDLYMGDQT